MIPKTYKIKALEDTIDLWEIIVEHDGIYKCEAMDILQERKNTDVSWEFNCPCCDLVRPDREDDFPSCKECPLYPDSHYGCEKGDTPYARWRLDPNKENAAEFLDYIKMRHSVLLSEE